MLWIKPNLPLTFDYDEYYRLLALVRTRVTTNKSNIIIANTSGAALGVGTAHRDVFSVDELNSPLVNKFLELMDYAYIRFLLIFLVEPGVPVLPHTHMYPGENEAHYQTIARVGPETDGPVTFEVAGNVFDLTGHNHFLLNAKLDHSVAPQDKPYLWLTSFCSTMK